MTYRVTFRDGNYENILADYFRRSHTGGRWILFFHGGIEIAAVSAYHVRMVELIK